MKSRLFSLAVILLASSVAFGWNCTDPKASRVDVGTSNPGGSSGDGDGQWFLGTGSEGTKGHYYVCEVPKKPTNGGGSCKGHSCNSTSGASSTSTSSSGATATGGNATATGGSVSGSGNSTIGPITNKLSNSGNSSNTNTNTANGGAGGAGGAGGNASQSQQQSNSSTNANNSSANGNGAGAGANSNNTTNNVAAIKVPVETAFAPTTIPTVSCFKGFGAGVQTMPVGASFGGGKIDPNCRALQTALHAPNRVTYCKIFIKLQDSKAAGITFEDCMGNDPKEAEVAPPAPAPVQPQVIVVPIQSPAPTVEPVIPVVEEIIPVGICTFASKTQCVPAGGDAGIVDPTRPTSVCKEMLTAARNALARHPGYVIVLRGNRNASEDKTVATSRAYRVKQQLIAEGVKSSQIKTEAGFGTARTVQITLEPSVQ